VADEPKIQNQNLKVGGRQATATPNAWRAILCKRYPPPTAAFMAG
jgi:hypothetical protein